MYALVSHQNIYVGRQKVSVHIFRGCIQPPMMQKLIDVGNGGSVAPLATVRGNYLPP